MSSTHPLARRCIAGVTSAVAAVALLAACQPSGGETTPPPSISPILPTTQTGSPSVSSSSSASATVSPSPSLVVTARPTTAEETAALAAEAEWVYREMRRLMDEYESQGGAETLPEPLKEFVGGVYASSAEKSLQFTFTQGNSFQGSTIVHRQAIIGEDLQPSSLIGIQFCNDMTGRSASAKGGSPQQVNALVRNRAEFSRASDGKLRITYNESKEASSCDG
ncbi:hypothetical protein [Aestuariimicrobium sp. Y1814]|uniref:hypothetical protein n=1 Tax=Aestuariimicrobium sp. Y1814 TaxID=3418742 RepID=UPI003DA74A87